MTNGRFCTKIGMYFWHTLAIDQQSQVEGGKNMKKQELIAAIAQSADITKKDAKAALEAAVAAITKALAEGDKVQVTDFGTFEVRERAARTGKNPRTGETIQIAASKVPAFKAGKVLKETVNG